MQNSDASNEHETVPENEIPKAMNNLKLALILSSPVLAPIAVIAVMIFFMFIACGWFFVGICFFTSAAAAIVGISGIIGAFINISNGVGSVLLMLGIGIGSLGFIYPIWVIAKEMLKGFTILHRELILKGKEIKEKLMKGLKEI